VPQIVTVTCVNDTLQDGDVGYTVRTLAAQTLDPGYRGLDGPDLGLVNTDNEPSVALTRFNGVYRGTVRGYEIISGIIVPVNDDFEFSVADGVITLAALGGGSGVLRPLDADSFVATFGSTAFTFNGVFRPSASGQSIFVLGSWTRPLERGFGGGGIWQVTKVLMIPGL
jgi:hypothetical protein